VFNTNVVAIFETEMKSVYSVDQYGMTCDKVADPNRKTEYEKKNIYYLIDTDSGMEILKARAKSGTTGKLKEPWMYSNVLSIMEDTHQLVMVLEGSDKKMLFDMYRSPKVGMQPFDFFCHENGKIASDHRAHVGHKITTIMHSKGA
jgi:hypothetical protein